MAHDHVGIAVVIPEAATLGHHLLRTLHKMDVRGANAASMSFYQNLSIAGGRDGDLPDPDLRLT